LARRPIRQAGKNSLPAPGNRYSTPATGSRLPLVVVAFTGGHSSRGIPIRFLTVVVRKAAIESGYPGGFARFLERHPRPLLEDEKLVGIVSMSTGEAEGTFVALKESGVDMDGAGALADMMLGPLRAASGIAFRREQSEDPLDPGWHAFDVDDSATAAADRT